MHEAPTQHVPLANILEPAHQLRASIDAEQLGELADSMAAEGLHQPIGLRGPLERGAFEIIWGHRRYLAARLLGWASIEGKVYPPEYDPLLAAVSENLQRADLSPMDEARAVARFVERGQPDAAIARLFRRSAGWVHERRALLALPPELQACIHERTLPLGVARALADVDHEDYRRELVSEAQRTGASTATAETWRAHYLADRERIVKNNLVVAEIRDRREAWRIYVPCDLCHEDHVYEETQALRLCRDCHAELLRIVEREVSAANP
jgi:ParB/RepB/Spo0J family partition protein